ncbi:MAG: hypothetical protein ABI663_17680 [Chryseolinea sp.]
MTIKTDGFTIRLFLFLCIGLSAELIMEFGGMTKEYKFVVFDIYCLLECTFFFWVISNYVDFLFKSLLKLFFFISFPLWIVCLFIIPGLVILEMPGIAFFNLIYEVAISFLAVHVLLKFIESSRQISAIPAFWFFLGVFFYCFTTFFLMSFIDSSVGKKIWWSHNVFNMITYLFYSISLWKAHTKGSFTIHR